MHKLRGERVKSCEPQGLPATLLQGSRAGLPCPWGRLREGTGCSLEDKSLQPLSSAFPSRQGLGVALYCNAGGPE